MDAKNQVDGTHYQKLKIDVIHFCEVNQIPFNEGSIIKYVCRHRDKNGKRDLLKARDFIDRLIATYDAQERHTATIDNTASQSYSLKR